MQRFGAVLRQATGLARAYSQRISAPAWARAAALAGLLGVALAWSGSPAQAGPLPLFILAAGPSGGPAALTAEPAARGVQTVGVNWGAIGSASQPGSVPPGQPRPSLLLNLRADLRLTAELDRIEPASGGGFAWVGRVAGQPYSLVSLVARDGTLSGNIHTQAGTFAVRPYAGGHVVYELDTAALPPEGQPVPVAAEPNDPAAPRLTGAQQDTGSLIDVLVVYTPAARDEAGGPGAMLSLIDLAVAETNAAYTNSQVLPRLRLAAAVEVTYAESGSFSTDLERLRTLDGLMDEVHALRNAYEADLVTLLVRRGGLCGLAYLMAPPSPAFAGWAFSVVAHNCATGYFSLGHELGHNMGSQHDRESAASPGAYSYSYGYRDPQSRFRTILAYDCPTSCPRIPYFSNPGVDYQGEVTGVHPEAPLAANNALSLSQTAQVVANFRQSATPVDPAGTPAPKNHFVYLPEITR